MHLTLEIKQKCSWFWLRTIHRVRIDKCCTGCFIGKKDNRVYDATYFRDHAFVSIDIEDDPKALAYYLCGISYGMRWSENTHIAFIPEIGSRIEFNNERVSAIITDARQIEFQWYKPNPPGVYTPRQRRCRNWMFANYIKDGLLDKEIKNHDSRRENNA